MGLLNSLNSSTATGGKKRTKAVPPGRPSSHPLFRYWKFVCRGGLVHDRHHVFDRFDDLTHMERLAEEPFIGFAAQGRKISDGMRSDFGGMAVEIGNAPLNPSQAGS